MKKKNIATVMATTMAVASVMPVFAAQENVTTVPVNVRAANGEELTVKSDTTIDGETVYSIEKTKLNDTAVVSAAKKTMDETIAKLEAMSKETIKVMEDGNVVVKNKYDIKIDEVASIFKYFVNQENGKLTDNKIVVVVKNNETKKVTNYEFNGVNKYDLDNNFGQGDIKFETIAIDLAYKSEYAKMAVLQYQLENAADKIVVTKEEFKYDNQINDDYNLRLTVTLKDGTMLGNIELMNVQAFDKDNYVSLPSNGDILGHWAEEYVLEAMVDKWVDTSVTFRPEDSITRAEFVKVVNRAFNIPVNNKQPRGVLFKDLEANMWYNKEIAAAVEAGYIEGYEDGTFRPNQPISRQEAAKIIANLHANKGKADKDKKPVEIDGQDTKTDFKDDADIAIWADESVDYLSKAGIITGYEDNTFKPAGNIKRVEAVVMMTRAVKGM